MEEGTVERNKEKLFSSLLTVYICTELKQV